MFVTPGLILLASFLYLHPAELFPVLRGIPFLYAFLGLTIFGFVVDLHRRKLRLELAPHLGWAVIFFTWATMTVLVRDAQSTPEMLFTSAVSFTVYFLLAHGIQRFRALETVCAAMLFLALFCSFVGVHQGFSAKHCMVLDPRAGDESGVFDGRPCESYHECEADGEPGAEYACEHEGLWGTSSVAGRVRYVGRMHDPNELSLMIGVALPFAFALVGRKRSVGRILLLLVSVGLIGLCIVFTESRGGQLVLLSVLGIYFVRSLGWRGLVLGALFALPILLFGGRQGEEAESSSLERLECWYEGIQMFRAYPLIGVGQGHFGEHHYLTAHNSYVLSAAELGFPGMFLFSVLLYVALKVPVSILRRFGDVVRFPEARVARTWALAFLASTVGMIVGIFFLSFCYSEMLWMFLALTGALAGATRAHDPSFRVELKIKEALILVGVDLALLIAIQLYTGSKI